jgi:molybdate transport system substrate-binding protein
MLVLLRVFMNRQPRSGDISLATGFSRWFKRLKHTSRVAATAVAPTALDAHIVTTHRLKPVANEMSPLLGYGTAFLSLFLIVATCLNAYAADVRVAAASDLNFAIKEIIAKFEKETGHHVLLTLGSSGNFHAQLMNGAPFDVFLSADANYPRELEKAGKAEPGSTFIYALGRIVVWVPFTSKIELQAAQMRSLLDPSIKKISIANPDHAPYGKAAVAAMQKAGIYESVRSKLVMGENISQAAQFVQSGAADIGIIALSLALADAMKSAGRYWEIPTNMYPSMEQGAVLMKGSGPAAREFHEWMRRPDTRQILTKYGFGLP